MEILINELSLSEQFDSVEHFIQIGLKPFVKVLNDIDSQSNSLYKKYDFYKAKITSQYTIHEVLTGDISRLYDEIRKLKSQLAKLFNNPYWEDKAKHSANNVYLFNESNICGSSLAEACERDKMIISFYHDDFRSTPLFVFKDECKIELDNLFEQEHFISIIYRQGFIPIDDYCRIKFKNSNLNFDNIDKKDGFTLIKTKEEEKVLLESLEMFSKLTWEEIRASDGLRYRKYDYDYEKKHFKGTGEKIDYFKISGKDRCYGYRKEDVFFVLGFDFEHKKSDGR